MQNIKETSDTLRGPKVNARKHWDGESWILEDAKTRKPLLIGHKPPRFLTNTIAVINPFKTLQKPLEAFKASKGFSLSATPSKERERSQGAVR